MLIDLRGRSAVVTGGASNIGRGITLSLANAGADVIIVDRDAEQASRTAALVPDRISTFMLDLTDLEAFPAAVHELSARNSKIDILVNNAGWVNTLPFLEKDVDEIRYELLLNQTSPLLLTRYVAEGMAVQGWGRIVTISSEAGRAGQRGQVAYSTAKAGLLGMTRSLSHELGRDGVTVNAVSPAMTVPKLETDVGDGSMQNQRHRPPEVMAKIVKSYPVGRVGHPDDIAAVVTFLCSDQAEFITGQTIPVNGGFSTT